MSTTLPLIEDLRSACTDGIWIRAREYLHVLVKAVVSSSSTAMQVASKDRLLEIKDLLKENSAILNILLDVVWLETSMAEPLDGSYQEPLIDLLKELVHHIPSLHDPLLEILDITLLKMVGVTTSVPELQKKIRLTNTQQFYRQHKFNLAVEESEGFAKFLHTVVLLLDESTPSSVVEKGSEMIMRLIASFSLDPNRCLDILLDILDRELEASNIIKSTGATYTVEVPKGVTSRLTKLLHLISGMALDKLPALLAFKFSSAKDGNRVLCYTAFLVRHNVLNLSEFLTCLPEWVTVLESTYDAVRKQERETVRSMGRVRLGSSSKPSEEKTKSVDISPVANHPTTHLILLLLKLNQFNTIESLFKPYWSMLCCLFPESIGCSICDEVEGCLTPYVGNRLGTLWAREPVPEPDVGKDGDISPSLSKILSFSVHKLEYTRESGCSALCPSLFCKLCRLLAAALENEKPSEECINFLRKFLLPSIGLFKHTPAVSMEVWKILQHLPYQTRYMLYSSWRGTGLERNAILSMKPLWEIQGEILAGKDARHALKRLSKDTIRDSCRAIAKVCHSHPLVVFSTILGQIESYDNLVQVMVDALRFVTPLSLDVLAFCILSRLDGTGGGGVNRSRLKDDGVNVSQWLQSLESFIGALYKHFPFLEMGGIMSYLMERVSTGHVMELGVLRMLLKEAGGWSFADYAPAASLSSTQLDGRAGSTLLKRETMSFGVFERFNKNASASVRRILLKDNVGVKLLILLSQLPFQIVFEPKLKDNTPVKLIGNLVDTCQVTTAMLLGFLTDPSPDNVAPDSEKTKNNISSFAKSLPSFGALREEYELDVASAWMLARPLIRIVGSGGAGSDGNSSEQLATAKSSKESSNAMPSETRTSHVTQSLFETFYTYTMYDVYCPEDIYKAEIDRLAKEEERLSRQSSTSQGNSQSRPTSEPDEASELARVRATATKLKTDLTEQKANVASCRDEIASNAKHFFVPEKNIQQEASLFFCTCIYPRCMKGPDDALYCARFILLLHSLEVPGLSTMHLLDVLIVSSSKSLFGLTEGEASNVAILLNEIWMTVSKWRYDEDEFNNGLGGKTVSRMVCRDEGIKEEVVPVSFKRFIEMYNKWHHSIGMTALGCLRSKEYMHARNALIVLTRMVGSFPTRPRLANKLLKDLQPMQDESFPFADLRASAQAYSTQLIKARDEGVWKEESAEAVEARLSKEKAAAAVRQKKAEQQMAQLKLDSEKITEEIGDKESWGRDRRAPHRSQGHEDSRTSNRGGGAGAVSDSKSLHQTQPKEREASHRHGGSTRDDSRSSRDRATVTSRNEPSSSAGTGQTTRRGQTSEDTRTTSTTSAAASRGLEGRWQKASAPEPSRGSKRSRSPSPVDPGEITLDDNGGRSKRQRQDNRPEDNRQPASEEGRKPSFRRRRR